MEFKVYPNKQSPKLFKSKYLEALTKSNIVVIDTMYILICATILYLFYTHQPVGIGTMTLWFLTGVLSWTFAEYIMHRFLYHKIKDASYDTGIQYMFHGIHHQYPHDNERLVLPVVPSLLLASVFFGLFYLIFGMIGIVFGAGFLIGYLVYITIHWSVHKLKIPQNRVTRFWWIHHNIHHYQQPDKAFGVSSPLWDIIFRTMPIKGRKTVTILIDTEKD